MKLPVLVTLLCSLLLLVGCANVPMDSTASEDSTVVSSTTTTDSAVVSTTTSVDTTTTSEVVTTTLATTTVVTTTRATTATTTSVPTTVSTTEATTIPITSEPKRDISTQLAGLFDGTYTEELAEMYVGVGFQMHFPDIVWIGDTIYAYYISYPAAMNGKPCIGVATSKDGLSFNKVTDSAIVAGPEEYDARMASFAGAWYEDGTVYVVYESTPASGGANIALATSTDGIHFEKQGVILYMDKSLKWQNYNIGTPDLYKVGDTWYLTFHGYGSEGKDCQIGLAYGEELALGKLTMHPEPIIPTSKNPEDPDSGTTGRRDIIYDAKTGYYYMVYEISTDQSGGHFGNAYWTHTFARSKDWIHWETMPPLIKQSGPGMGYDGPCFVQVGGKIYVYVRGYGNASMRMRFIPK